MLHNYIRNEHISILKLDKFGQKARQSRLRWYCTAYGHVKFRDDEYLGRKVLEMQLSGKDREDQIIL